jgi:hypothetical protein
MRSFVVPSAVSADEQAASTLRSAPLVTIRSRSRASSRITSPVRSKTTSLGTTSSTFLDVPLLRADQGMWRCLMSGQLSRPAQRESMGLRRVIMPLEEPSSDAVQK